MWMRAITAAAMLAMTGACAGDDTSEGSHADMVANGKMIAETQCGRCHATGPTGESPRPDAPVFRHLLARYGADPLADALINGIKVGHPDMPLFEINPVGVDSLIVYLKSIQTPDNGERR